MRATLLLADDSVTIQRVIELTFANENVHVITVSDGEEALAQIDAQRPDIVLADVSLPKVDGYGISFHVKESAELKETPVLLLTGAFEPIDDDKARDCKCDSVLVKPFEPQDLIGRVRELLMPKEEAAKLKATEPAEAAAPSSTVAAVLEVPEVPALAAPRMIEAPSRSVIEPIPFSQIDDDDFDMDLDRLHQQFVQPGTAAAGQSNLTPGGGSDGSPSDVHPPARPNPASFGDWDIPKKPVPALALPAAMVEPVPSLAVSPPSVSAPSPAAFPAAAGVSPTEPDGVKPATAASSEKVSITSAFSALLAAEQSQPARFSRPLPAISEAAIEEVVHRVLARMSEETVRRIVLENAERIIRQEIERINNK